MLDTTLKAFQATSGQLELCHYFQFYTTYKSDPGLVRFFLAIYIEETKVLRLCTKFKVLSRCANVCSKILKLAETQDRGGKYQQSQSSHMLKRIVGLINTIQQLIKNRVTSTSCSVKSLLTRLVVTYLRLCLLYTSPSPRDATLSRMPSSA